MSAAKRRCGDMAAVSAYYNRVFPISAVEECFSGMKLVDRQMWGRPGTSEKHWKSYDSITALYKAALTGDTVEMHVSLGETETGHYQHFVLDLDIEECADRFCCGKRKHLCDACLPLVQQWGLLVQQIVAYVLAVTPDAVMCIFSGTKGLHIWAKLRYPVLKAMRDSIYAMIRKTPEWIKGVPSLVPFVKSFIHCISLRQFQHSFKETRTTESISGAIRVIHATRSGQMTGTDIDIHICFTIFKFVLDESVTSSTQHNIGMPLSVAYHKGTDGCRRVRVPIAPDLMFYTMDSLPNVHNLTPDVVKSITRVFSNSVIAQKML
jgi:hypothetical protein